MKQKLHLFRVVLVALLLLGVRNVFGQEPNESANSQSSVGSNNTASFPCSSYFENGLRKMQGQEDSLGHRTGRFTWWHANGTKQCLGDYAEGKKNGLWHWWHNDGKYWTTAHFKDDQLLHRWADDQTGKLFHKVKPTQVASESKELRQQSTPEWIELGDNTPRTSREPQL